jgi:Peptidase_C39 like family
MRFLKWMIGLGVMAALAVGAGLGLAFFTSTPPTTYYTNTALVPFDKTVVAQPSGDAQPTPIDLPATVSLPVPFTSQAPLNDWSAKQHTCEEATLVMVDRFLKGDRSGNLIDPHTADAAINLITTWKPVQDMRYAQYGEMARSYLGYGYQILDATRINIKTELALGRPVIVGVRTHGLGNPHYPGFYSHHEETGWSVSHYIDVVGYDSNDTVILNDPGISAGHGYHISFDQLFFAISDLDQAYPNLNDGQKILVLAPIAGA